MLLKSFVLVVLCTGDHLISNREGPRVPSTTMLTHRASFTKASHPFQITGKTELLGSLGTAGVQKLLKNSTNDHPRALKYAQYPYPLALVVYIFWGVGLSLFPLTPRGHFSLLAFLHFLTILTTFLVSACIYSQRAKNFSVEVV